MEKKTINGIDVDALNEIVGQIQDNPSLARFRFRAINSWIRGTHNRSQIQGFYGAGQEHDPANPPFVHEEDEPPLLLGGHNGANPVEYLLTGLSGCLTTSLVAQAAVHGVKLDAVESRLEGDIDVRGFLGLSDEVRNGYESIRVTFKIKSDAPREKLEELVRLASERSPAADTIANPVHLTVQLE